MFLKYTKRRMLRTDSMLRKEVLTITTRPSSRSTVDSRHSVLCNGTEIREREKTKTKPPLYPGAPGGPGGPEGQREALAAQAVMFFSSLVELGETVCTRTIVFCEKNQSE